MKNTYIFAVCLLWAGISVAQDAGLPRFDPVAAAEEEALRRAETKMIMDLNLAKAEKLKDAKDYGAAAVYYEEVIGLASKLGNLTAVQESVEEAKDGLVHSRLQSAYKLQDEKQFSSADKEAAQALAVVGGNSKLLKFRKFNAEVEAAHQGRVPSEAVVQSLKAIRDEKAQVFQMIRDGRAYFELGQYVQAEERLKEAIKLDPHSDLAYYYLRLILEAQYDEESRKREHKFQERVVEVSKAWNKTTRTDLPTPNPYYTTNSQVPFLTHTSQGAQHIRRKLHEIMIPEVAYDALTLDEVVADLIDTVKREDPDGKGLNFLINSQVMMVVVVVVFRFWTQWGILSLAGVLGWVLERVLQGSI
jgi:hypothetical protein